MGGLGAAKKNTKKEDVGAARKLLALVALHPGQCRECRSRIASSTYLGVLDLLGRAHLARPSHLARAPVPALLV